MQRKKHQANQSKSQTELKDSSRSIARERFSQSEFNSLVDHLGGCLISQRTYGKQGGDILALVKIFIYDLRDLPPSKVIDAVEEWRKYKKEFPTQGDIREMIQPTPKRDASVYNRFLQKRKEGDWLTQVEEDYIKWYEAETLKGI